MVGSYRNSNASDPVVAVQDAIVQTLVSGWLTNLHRSHAIEAHLPHHFYRLLAQRRTAGREGGRRGGTGAPLSSSSSSGSSSCSGRTDISTRFATVGRWCCRFVWHLLLGVDIHSHSNSANHRRHLNNREKLICVFL